eukprot:12870517-Prorocentrum_lima.AAC.1
MSPPTTSNPPARPVPEQGLHDPINHFRPPPQGPEQQVGPEVTSEEQEHEELEWMTNLHVP